MSVPCGHPIGSTVMMPSWAIAFNPSMASGCFVSKVTVLTAAILASASPRNPNVVSDGNSSTDLILLVACFAKQSCASSRSIPHPLSTTRMSCFPPSSIKREMCVAPASIAFSSNSFTAFAGRSTTWPAAIFCASCADNCLIRAIKSQSL
ncbi:MAG: hypothetical protein ACD_64C00105G0001 [uncultured bacterium]|nr:MAG: hypothetical protein ACD_64C00105G0001 [uncultured bacterium]